MSLKIRQLSSQTINQIAAGEVIENPASVVKELVENALDASSTHIVIEVKGGGQQLIRVSDNGSGMSQDDALLSLERHATSKIQDVSDLWTLSTMGFRGEALASIAAISKLTLTTSLHTQGAQVEIEGGKLLRTSPCARAQGTTVEVRSLFYNVPARKKFQKSAGANNAEILRIIFSLSLAYPEVSFELLQQDVRSFFAPIQSFRERIAYVMGEEFMPSLKEISIHLESNSQLSGYISTPSLTRPNRTGQYLFVNRRSVHCPFISYAVKNGFGTRLSSDRHPVYVLKLELPPSWIDVNVHPQKREIRFKEEAWIKEKICQAIANSFLTQPSSFTPSFQSEPLLAYSFPLRFKEEREESAAPSFLPSMEEGPKPIGLFKHYLLMSQGEILTLVDLKAASAQIAFDAMLNSKEKTSLKQGLLFPVSIDFSSVEFSMLKPHLESLEEIGFSIHLAGPHTLLIDAIPSFMKTTDVADTVRQMIDELLEEKECTVRSLAVLASRRAKEGAPIQTVEEAMALLKALMRTSSPTYCPLGKPIMVDFDEDTLKHYFS